MKVNPVHSATSAHSRCLVALIRTLRADSGDASSFMRCGRSPSTRLSIHMKISV